MNCDKSAVTSRGGPGPFQGPSSYPQLVVADREWSKFCDACLAINPELQFANGPGHFPEGFGC